MPKLILESLKELTFFKKFISKSFETFTGVYLLIILWISQDLFIYVASAVLLVTFLTIVLAILFSEIYPAIPSAKPLRIPLVMLSVINWEMLLGFVFANIFDRHISGIFSIICLEMFTSIPFGMSSLIFLRHLSVFNKNFL